MRCPLGFLPRFTFRSNRKCLVDDHGDLANGRNAEIIFFYLQDEAMVRPGHLFPAWFLDVPNPGFA